MEWLAPGLNHQQFLKVAKSPTSQNTFLKLIQSPSGHSAVHFVPAFSRFIALFNDPSLTHHQLDHAVFNTFLFCRSLPVWNSFKFQCKDHLTKSLTTTNIIHAHGPANDSQGRLVSTQFDTVLINKESTGNEIGIRGRQMAHICLIFSLLPKVIPALFNNDVQSKVPIHLVYVERLTSFPAQPDHATGLYKVSKSMLHDGSILSSVVPLSQIYQSIHLLPKFGLVTPSSWNSSNVLNECAIFYFNTFTDQHLYAKLHL
jgi:hypothetical protein